MKAQVIRETVGYQIDVDAMNKIKEIVDQLHGGSDKERDIGHRLYLVMMNAVPVVEETVIPGE